MSEARKTYLTTLSLDDPNQKVSRKSALERAHDIRKFEIELYWKRSNYFWVLQGAVFAAIGFAWDNRASAVEIFLPVLLAGLGLLTAWAGYLAAQGSKFWQRNWEHHIDMLETEFEGNLYKSVYVGPSGMKWSLSGMSESMALCFVGFWALVLVSVTHQANPHWNLIPGNLTTPSPAELLTLLALILTVIGLRLLHLRGSGATGTLTAYPEDFDEQDGNEQADCLGKSHLLRRKPKI